MGAYLLHYNTFYNRTGNAVLYGDEPHQNLRAPVYDTQSAWTLDKKIDDGISGTGNVMGIDAYGGGSGCNVPRDSGEYALGYTGPDMCLLVFTMD